MNIYNSFRNELQKVPFLNDWIDDLTARINAIFGVEHDPATGQHTTITATSVAVTGAVSSGSTGTFNDNVTADADGTPVAIGSVGSSAGPDATNGPGVEMDGGSNIGKWDVIARLGTFRELRFIDRTNGYTPVQIRRETTGPTYHLMPSPVTTVAVDCNLGSTNDSFGAGRWSNAYVKNCDSTNGYKERARTTALGEWIEPAFSAAVYTGAGGLVWTVTSGQQERYGYSLVGNLMFFGFRVNASTLSVAANSEMRIAIPGGFSATRNMNGTFTYYVNSVSGVGSWDVEIGDTFVRLANGFPSTNWGLNTNLTFVLGQLFIEVS